MAADIPDHVRRLVARHIASVAQLEVLLLVRGAPDEPWSSSAVASTMRMDATWAGEQLRELTDAGLLREEGGSYRYAPGRKDAATIDELAALFSTHRIAIITLIASQPSRRIQSFTDAFRLRKDDDGG